MFLAKRFSDITNHVYTKRAICFGVVPLVFTGLNVMLSYDKLDVPARTADYNAAQLVAKDLGSFIEKAKPSEEDLVYAYNSRKTYLNAPANVAVEGCMRTALLPEHGSIEIAQTVPQTKMTSYRAPMATDLQYANTSTVAVVNFSKTALTDCAQAAFTRQKEVPTADQARTTFYKDVGSGLLFGMVGGAFIYNQWRRREAPRASRSPPP